MPTKLFRRIKALQLKYMFLLTLKLKVLELFRKYFPLLMCLKFD